MKLKLICTALLAAIIVCSCNKNETNKETATDLNLLEQAPAADDKDKANGEDQQIPVGTEPQQAAQYDSAPPVLTTTSNIDWDKKIIKTASVKLEVKSFNKYNDALHKKIKQYGGYIAGEDNFFTDQKSEMVVTVKVPVAQFEPLMNELGGADIKVIERSIKTEDVTGQVVDTKSRLEAKKQMRLKYLEFLKQSKNMTEVLQVQDEINSIQEQIESAAGRIQYLSNQSAYSTINLTFYEPKPGFEPVDTTPSFFAQAAEGFKTGADFIKNVALGLITIWPLLILAFIAFYMWRRNKPVKITPPNPNV